MKNGYLLVGFINLLDIIPGFVYPVFAKDDKYFFQHGDNDRLYEFEEINPSLMKKLIPLESDVQIIIDLDSNPIYAYQRKNEILFGDSTKMKSLIQKIRKQTTGEHLQKDLDGFMEEISNKNVFNLPTVQIPKEENGHYDLPSARKKEKMLPEDFFFLEEAILKILKERIYHIQAHNASELAFAKYQEISSELTAMHAKMLNAIHENKELPVLMDDVGHRNKSTNWLPQEKLEYTSLLTDYFTYLDNILYKYHQNAIEAPSIKVAKTEYAKLLIEVQKINEQLLKTYGFQDRSKKK